MRVLVHASGGLTCQKPSTELNRPMGVRPSYQLAPSRRLPFFWHQKVHPCASRCRGLPDFGSNAGGTGMSGTDMADERRTKKEERGGANNAATGTQSEKVMCFSDREGRCAQHEGPAMP
jgi:hypothetical protein